MSTFFRVVSIMTGVSVSLWLMFRYAKKVYCEYCDKFSFPVRDIILDQNKIKCHATWCPNCRVEILVYKRRGYDTETKRTSWRPGWVLQHLSTDRKRELFRKRGSK